MLARHMQWSCVVICLSQVNVLSNQLDTSSCKECYMVALGLQCNTSWQNSNGVTSNGLPAKYACGRKICYFQQTMCYILRMVKDRRSFCEAWVESCMCSIKLWHCWQHWVTLTISNHTPVFVLWLFLHISGMAEATVFKFFIKSKLLRITNHEQMDAVMVTWPILEF